MVRQLLREYTPSLTNMRALLGSAVYHQELITDELVQLRYDMSLRALASQQTRGSAGSSGGLRPLVVGLHEIQAKTLIIWGAQDQSSVDKALLVAQAITGAELHIFDQCAHWVMWDHRISSTP